MTKQKWITKSCKGPGLAQYCEDLTDAGYWIYGVYEIPYSHQPDSFRILACKAKEDSVE